FKPLPLKKKKTEKQKLAFKTTFCEKKKSKNTLLQHKDTSLFLKVQYDKNAKSQTKLTLQYDKSLES
ncbi:hypothetical protein, partial [Helicobacter cinaedi]|uniref:hypothetical protein n=1 Tax=Helicobacter cinaedi TaxID=213 RepID=UPI001A9E5CB9